VATGGPGVGSVGGVGVGIGVGGVGVGVGVKDPNNCDIKSNSAFNHFGISQPSYRNFDYVHNEMDKQIITVISQSCKRDIHPDMNISEVVKDNIDMESLLMDLESEFTVRLDGSNWDTVTDVINDIKRAKLS
jgi:acyl carrier protein